MACDDIARCCGACDPPWHLREVAVAHSTPEIMYTIGIHLCAERVHDNTTTESALPGAMARTTLCPNALVPPCSQTPRICSINKQTLLITLCLQICMGGEPEPCITLVVQAFRPDVRQTCLSPTTYTTPRAHTNIGRNARSYAILLAAVGWGSAG